MEKLFKIATSISTPLAAAGLVLAILFYVILQMLKTKNNVNNILYRVIIKYLFFLSLIALVLGFSGFIYTQYNSDNKDLALKGIVFVGGQELAGVQVEILEARVTTQTDPYGTFSLNFDKRLGQKLYTLKFLSKFLEQGQTIIPISSDSLSKYNHFYLRKKKDSVRVAIIEPEKKIILIKKIIKLNKRL